MIASCFLCSVFFFLKDTATTEIYTLSLHDALPIFRSRMDCTRSRLPADRRGPPVTRSEEHTSELQSHSHLVCRLLLVKKKDTTPLLVICCAQPWTLATANFNAARKTYTRYFF